MRSSSNEKNSGGTPPGDPVREAVRAAVSPARLRRKKTVFLTACLSALIVLFIALSLLVSSSAYTPADLAITKLIQSIDNPAVAAAMEAVSWPGYAPQSFVVAAFFVLLLLTLGLRWESTALAATAASEELVNMAVKAFIHRPRPSAQLIRVFVSLESYSFPSGHVMFYTCLFGFAFFLAFMLLRPSWKRTALLLLSGFPVPAVGLSRIYLGEHWASDVLGAYLAGSVVLICGVRFYRWGKNRNLLRQGVARGRK